VPCAARNPHRRALCSPRFRPETYSLLNHNCNNFTSECAQFLVGRDIPAFITGLPQEFLATPLGQMFAPFIHQMEQQMKCAPLRPRRRLPPR
jgi:hypothetical protein